MFAAKDLFINSGVGGYFITKSLRFRASASAYLSKTFASSGNRTVWTFSFWVKRGELGRRQDFLNADVDGASDASSIFFDSSDKFNIQNFVAGAYKTRKITNAVFRDTSAWYHIVISQNGSTATTVYVNGVSQSFGTSVGPDASNWYINSTTPQRIGGDTFFSTAYFDGYFAEFYFIDGQALAASDFGQNDTNGVWQPKSYTGTYGTNGYYLKFTDASAATATTIGKDSSPNGNNFTPTNISVTSGTTYDSMIDSPTNYSGGDSGTGNYCVLSALNKLTTATLAAAGLQYTSSASGQNAIASIGVSSGKWYWEAQTSAGTTEARATVYGTSAASYYSFAANNTVYGFRFDAGAGTFDQTSDGTNWTSIATGLTSGPYFPYFNNNGTTSKTIAVNFGQRPFSLSIPSGYASLNTQNFSTPTISNGALYTNPVIYTGNGASRSITGLSFQPDLVWIKSRSNAQDNKLTDAVRGVTKALISNTTGDETTDTNGVTAFNSNGFSLGTDATYNTNAYTYVSWNWKESVVSGFDILTYTGTGVARTISHNLGVTPNLIIVKARTTASTDQGWPVYHSANTSPAENYYLLLNTTDATAALSTVWNNTAPTSSVFSVGTNANVNANNDTYVAYLWAAVAGYSAFGSFTGNASADGPFVYTGFMPMWIMLKNITTGGAGYDWWVYDAVRDTYNASVNKLLPNSSNAEDTSGEDIDILSNGFKIRSTAVGINASSATIIYVAFASNPFKYSRAR